MNFSEKLNNYIKILNCTAKELSKASNISTSVLCRYRKEERIPKYNSKQFNSLVKGINTIALEKNITNLNYSKIYKDLKSSLNPCTINPDTFRNHFNTLINTLHINVSDLSRYIGFDSSYISKIKTGQRIPQHLNDFIEAIVKYITDNYQDKESLTKISSITNINQEHLEKKEQYQKLLKQWIKNEELEKENKEIKSFLTKLDVFDLNDYIKSIHFDKLKVPTSPIQIPKSKTYYGIEGFKKAQIDVLKSIILSKSTEDIFFYSNMPILEGSKDTEFKKKFMIGLAYILKKGLHLHMIHNLDRPWNELMLGLEGWIPLYMTGQIHPYYFKNNSKLPFSHILCTSKSAALSGFTLTENINLAKLYVTTKKNEVNYYQQNTKTLLKNANKLMDIYDIESKKLFQEFLNNIIIGNRRNIYYNLPIYTISNQLLKKILRRNNISPQDEKIISNYVKNERIKFLKILERSIILDEISIITKEEFQKQPCSLSLSNIFYPKKITYTYSEYLEHIELIKQEKRNNYQFKINNHSTFKNINIKIIKNTQVIISKENSPSIHFVIHHPKLIEAISHFKIKN